MSIFIFIINQTKNTEEKRTGGTPMCDKLDNLSKLKVEDLYDIFEEEFKAPPINITNILDKLEVEYNAVDFSQLTGNINGIKLPEQADLVMGAVAAFTEEDDGKDAVEITVNEKDTYHRQRFTLAHELGHCMTDAENLRNGFLELRTSVNTDESR